MMFGKSSGPLPDWAIISIAVTLCLTVIAGGSLGKKELRTHLMRIIRIFLMKDQMQEIPDPCEDNVRNIRNSYNKDIELQTITCQQ